MIFIFKSFTGRNQTSNFLKSKTFVHLTTFLNNNSWFLETEDCLFHISYIFNFIVFHAHREIPFSISYDKYA